MSRKQQKGSSIASLKENNPFMVNKEKLPELNTSNSIKSENEKTLEKLPSEYTPKVLGESNMNFLNVEPKDSLKVDKKPEASPGLRPPAQLGPSPSPSKRVIIEEKPLASAPKDWEELAPSANSSMINIQEIPVDEEKAIEYENHFPSLGDTQTPKTDKEFKTEILSPKNIVRTQLHHESEHPSGLIHEGETNPHQASSMSDLSPEASKEEPKLIEFEELKQSHEEKQFLESLNAADSTNAPTVASIPSEQGESIYRLIYEPEKPAELIKSQQEIPDEPVNEWAEISAVEEAEPVKLEPKAEAKLEEKVEEYEHEFPSLGAETTPAHHEHHKVEAEPIEPSHLREIINPTILVVTAPEEVKPIDIIENLDHKEEKKRIKEREVEAEEAERYKLEFDSDYSERISNASEEMVELKKEAKVMEYELLFPPLGIKSEDAPKSEVEFNTHMLDKEILETSAVDIHAEPIDITSTIAHEAHVSKKEEEQFHKKDVKLLEELGGGFFVPTEEPVKKVEAPKVAAPSKEAAMTHSKDPFEGFAVQYKPRDPFGHFEVQYKKRDPFDHFEVQYKKTDPFDHFQVQVKEPASGFRAPGADVELQPIEEDIVIEEEPINRKGSLEFLDENMPRNELTLSSQRIDLIKEELRQELKSIIVPEHPKASDTILFEFEKNLMIAKDLQKSGMWGASINILKKNLETLNKFEAGKSIFSIEKMSKVMFDYNIELAYNFSRIGDARSAATYARAAMASMPRSARAQHLLASSLIKLQDFAAADEILRNAKSTLQQETADEFSSLIDSEILNLNRIWSRPAETPKEDVVIEVPATSIETPAGKTSGKIRRGKYTPVPRIYATNWTNIGYATAAAGSSGALAWFLTKSYTTIPEKKGLWYSIGLGALVGGLTYMILSHAEEKPTKGSRKL